MCLTGHLCFVLHLTQICHLRGCVCVCVCVWEVNKFQSCVIFTLPVDWLNCKEYGFSKAHFRTQHIHCDLSVCYKNTSSLNCKCVCVCASVCVCAHASTRAITCICLREYELLFMNSTFSKENYGEDGHQDKRMYCLLLIFLLVLSTKNNAGSDTNRFCCKMCWCASGWIDYSDQTDQNKPILLSFA